jgi:hypothetical protein
MTTDAHSAETCVCGHARAAHEHYRKGSDCGVCGADRCARYAHSSLSADRPAAKPASAESPRAVNT